MSYYDPTDEMDASAFLMQTMKKMYQQQIRDDIEAIVTGQRERPHRKSATEVRNSFDWETFSPPKEGRAHYSGICRSGDAILNPNIVRVDHLPILKVLSIETHRYSGKRDLQALQVTHIMRPSFRWTEGEEC